MKLNNLELFATVLCVWLSGFLLGLWHATPYITDREAGLILAFSIVVTIIIVHKHLNKNAVVAHLNSYVGEVHNMTIVNMQESCRERIATLKMKHGQTLRETREEIRRLHAKIDGLHLEHDFISALYQDQMRLNDEQGDRIVYLENKLKESAQLTPGAAAPPFSAPASQLNFANPPHRLRSFVTPSSPLAQAPMVQEEETEEE